MGSETLGQNSSDYNGVSAATSGNDATTVSAGTDPTAVRTGSSQTSQPSQQQDNADNRNLDRRARLRPKPGAADYIYGAPVANQETSLLSILRETNGLVFPTTPTITETHAVQYSSHSPSHSISKFNNFERTDNVNINISGDYLVSNATEAKYLLSCIHFLRSVTKMDFGISSDTRGTPPPVLLFSAYGNFMYNDIPVIIKGVTFTMEPDIDYIQVPLFGNKTDFGKDLMKVSDFYRTDSEKPNRVWVPSKLTISLTLEQQPTPYWVTNQFNLNKFKRGELLTKGGLI